MNCPDGMALQRVQSTFDSSKYDREVKFYCASIEGHDLEDCKWELAGANGYENWKYQDVRFTCPAGKVIAGVDSQFTGYDRQYR